jgi:hypothetical protein
VGTAVASIEAPGRVIPALVISVVSRPLERIASVVSTAARQVQTRDPVSLVLVPWYVDIMSKEQVKAILDRVLTWPEQRQEDAAKVLMLMEASDQSAYRLTDEQVAEVERRLADPNPRRLTLDEFKERLARRIEQ